MKTSEKWRIYGTFWEMGRATRAVFISLPGFSNSRWIYHKNFSITTCVCMEHSGLSPLRALTQCLKHFFDKCFFGTLPGSDRVSSKGYIVRWVEAPSNKLLTTAFEASLESVTVTCRLSVDSKIAGIAMEHRNPKVSEGRHRGQGGRQYMHLSLWWDFACLCGVVETIHVRQGLYVNWRGPVFSFQSV